MNNKMHIVNIKKCLLWFVFCLSSLFCKNQEHPSVYKYIKPQYTNINISVTDTISFKLPPNTYNVIKSFNYFTTGNKEYISFYDRTSESINIYDFSTKEIVKRILLKEVLSDTIFYKTGIFVKNFDSLIVNNYTSLYILDTAGNIKQSIPLQENPYLAFVSLKNHSLPVFRGDVFYASALPYLPSDELVSLRKWTVLYKVDMRKRKATTLYHLSKTYRSNIYSYFFLNNSYCINNEGKFVFSFPADTNIYVTNLADSSWAYFGRSRYQKECIRGIPKSEVGSGMIDELSFYLNDSYGAIYFDELRKRYLRAAQRKITKAEYAHKHISKRQSLIIFDENFKIISESNIDSDINLFTIFFTKDGKMYAQANTGDQDTLHFVRLQYN